jgi:hypothetical protein
MNLSDLKLLRFQVALIAIFDCCIKTIRRFQTPLLLKTTIAKS